MRSVTKNIFLNTLACPTLGWFLRSEAEETRREPTLAERFHTNLGVYHWILRGDGNTLVEVN